MTTVKGRLVLVALGVFVFATVGTGQYLNYVRPEMRPLLLLTGSAVLFLGMQGALDDWRRRDRARSAAEPSVTADDPADAHGHGHQHTGLPPLAWLLTAPAVCFLLLAPPSLGAFSAERAVDAVRVVDTDAAWPPLPPDPVVDLPVSEYVARALWDPGRTLEGRTVRLVGFVTSGPDGGWFLTRMSIQCCAGDASAWRVSVVADGPAPALDQWVEVEGTWVPTELPATDAVEAPAQVRASLVREATAPEIPYE